jgi:hypothetical protein
MISLQNYEGRFANHFFRNIAFSYIVKQHNIKVEYALQDHFIKMGFHLLNNNTDDITTNNITQNVTLNDSNFFDYIKIKNKTETEKYNQSDLSIQTDISNKDNKQTTNNFKFNFKLEHNTYCQTREFVLFLYDQYYIDPVLSIEKQISIINANKYKSRYENNDDVCIHVRLGDVSQYNPGFAYYDNILTSLKFTNGYICSDSPNHPTVKKLIEKYKLKIVIGNEPDTIMFASTCKYLILSQGTFSWLIGFLGFFSEVYFPKIKKKWHGDIFVIPTWNEIDW